MGSKIVLYYSFLIAFLTFSCGEHKSDHEKKIFTCDSIIYKISTDAENILYDMIKNRKVYYCSLVTNTNDNKYIFSFSYADKTVYSEKDSILARTTNRYIKLKDYYFPIVLYSDILFSDIKEEGYVINDFNYCFVEVDAQGKYIGGYAY